MKNIHIETLGCRLNQIESEAAARFFIDNKFNVIMGGLSSSSLEDLDCSLAIINTCTVTQKSEQKARRLIRLMLKKYPDAAVLVTGCYAQLAPDAIKAMDKRVCVIGGQIKSRIQNVPKMLEKALNDSKYNPEGFAALINTELNKLAPEKANYPENSFALSTSSFIAHSRASLKIQDGCNSSCSYCAIHIARGKSVSIPVQTALERVTELENKGHDEVIITTVNIGQYRSEFNGQIFNFTKLLNYLLENTNNINFRISSLYPEVVDEEFCKVISNDRVRPHFHLSVQSGSDKILKSMNRAYKSDAVISVCQKLRECKKDCFLACDIITGFPGETEEDFECTMELVKKCDFSWVHAFPYSERPGTVAATMKNKVTNEISGKRARQITQWAINNKITYVEKFAGKNLSAIVETVRKPMGLSPELNNQNLIYHAVTENFIHCEIRTKKPLEVNKQITVKILKPLSDRIIKGGEIEASADIISVSDK